jgi:RimJ/RimL family protein N-acetyltransferase
MIESRGVFKAVPLGVHRDPAKLEYILDRLVEHETEWSDFQKGRREIASGLLAQHYTSARTCILEVWRVDEAPELCGLIAFTDILRGVDAQAHLVFFDGKLRNLLGKRDLLLRTMDWAFQTWDLHRLSLTLPETSFALVDFARKKLGFRFEGERRNIKQRRAVEHGHLKSRRWLTVTPSAQEAEVGSRRYQALYQHGEWRDVLLLSLTRDEFANFAREVITWAPSSTDPIPSKLSPKISKVDDSR